MQKIKRAVTAALLLLVAVLVFFFTIENRQLVQLSVMGKASPNLPLALFILLVFVLGLVVGFAINVLRNKGLERRCRKQAKELEKLQQQQKPGQVILEPASR